MEKNVTDTVSFEGSPLEWGELPVYSMMVPASMEIV